MNSISNIAEFKKAADPGYFVPVIITEDRVLLNATYTYQRALFKLAEYIQKHGTDFNLKISLTQIGEYGFSLSCNREFINIDFVTRKFDSSCTFTDTSGAFARPPKFDDCFSNMHDWLTAVVKRSPLSVKDGNRFIEDVLSKNLIITHNIKRARDTMDWRGSEIVKQQGYEGLYINI